MSDEDIDRMCPECRSRAHEWIVDIGERVVRIDRASNRLQLSAFMLGAISMFVALAIFAWCNR